MVGRVITKSTFQMLRESVKPDVYPIVGIVCLAATFMTYKSYEHLTAPDVFLDPKRRASDAVDKYDAKEGDTWRNRVMKFYRHRDDDVGNLSIFEPLSSGWWSRRSEVQSNSKAVASGSNHMS